MTLFRLPPSSGSVLHTEDAVYEQPQTLHRDYVLQDYDPPCDPTGGLHPLSLFRHVLRAEGLLDSVWPIASSLRSFLGAEQTVWGFKYDNQGQFGVEFYLYRNQGPEDAHRKSVEALVECLKPLIEIPSEVDERLPYFMLSLELNKEVLQRGQADGFRVYTAADRRVAGFDGLSYLVAGRQLLLENYYCFYGIPNELGELRQRLTYLPRAGSASSQKALLPDYLSDCHTICQATKQRGDGLYFSRIRTSALERFLATYLPGPALDLIQERQAELEHLLWDIGIDYSVAFGTTEASVRKAGIYGVL